MSIKDYEKPSVTTDIVLFRVSETENVNKRRNSNKTLQVLLLKRDIEPEKGEWSLPGGFVNIDEEIYSNVVRKLREKTGLYGDFYVEQLYTWGDLNRDSRGRVISVSYLGLCNSETLKVEHTENEIVWADFQDILDGKYGDLSFDHLNIIICAFKRIQNKLEYTDIAFNLLPSEFTIRECQDIYEFIVGHTINNFRRNIAEYIEAVSKEKKIEGKQFRPSQLYKRSTKNISRF